MSIQDQNRITSLEQRLAVLEAWLAEFKVTAGLKPPIDIGVIGLNGTVVTELQRDIEKVAHANLDVIGRKGKK